MLLREVSINDITFTYHEDCEGDKNRGWQVDRIDAHRDGKIIGYIKISHIPHERFNAWYPTALNFISQIEGKSVLPYLGRNKSVPYWEIPPDKLRQTITTAAIALWPRYPSFKEQARLESLSDEDVVKEYDKLEQLAWVKYRRKIRQFRHYYVDKPIVDYIHVDLDSRRQGIGTALYRAAHEWLKQRGLKLYASGLQSNEARAAWHRMKDQYPIGYEIAQINQQKYERKYFAD